MLKPFIRNIVFALFLSSIFSGCSTDVDNYADYKDVTIVYGLLETGTDTTFIKITKAFLGPGNALHIAQNPDSSNYNKKLDVRLSPKLGNNTLDDIILDTITINNKLPGDSLFYFPQQLLYYTTAPIIEDATYTLLIDKGNEVIQAETKPVKDFFITLPTNRMNFAATVPTPIKWNAAVNGKRYEVMMVFNYDEVYPGSADTVKQTMSWRLGTRFSDRLDGTDKLEITYLGETFYTRLGNELNHALNVKRFARELDLYISCGGDELSTYIDVNAPSNSIVQEIPEYTNIENGYGIFSARKLIKRSYKLSVQSELKLVEEHDWGFIIQR